MDIKKRNHYIPKVYLRRFLNDKAELFVYKKGKYFFDDKTTKNDRLLTIIGEDGLNNIAVKRNLYIPESDQIEDKNLFEDFFSQEIESKYDEFVKFVEDNFFNAPEIFSKYRDYIITLIASMMSRTLHSKTEVEEIYKVNFQMHNWAKTFNPNSIPDMKAYLAGKFPEMTTEEIDKTIKDYTEMVKNGEFEIQLPRNLFIKHIFENCELYSNLISDMTIQILKSEEPNYFITTDAPVVYFVPKEKVNFYFSYKSLGGPYTELYFPITKNLCLVLSRIKIDVLSGIFANKEMVDTINYNLSHNSRDFIYSPIQSDVLDNFIEKFIPYPFEFRIQK